MQPPLPPERPVELPGLGTVPVREVPGPAGAPTLVLLHGWTVTADLNWFRCYEELGRDHRVLAFDHRGHGRGLRSGRFSFDRCAADVAAVIDSLATGPVVVVGYSMGGCIAQLLARDHPHLVAGLVLCATSRSFRGTGAERARFALVPPISRLSRLTPTRLRDRLYSRVLESQLAGPGLTEWAKDQIRSCDPQFLLDAGAELYRFDSSSWVPRLEVPAAVVVTEQDRRVPPERQHALAASLADATVHRVDGNHVVCVGSPARLLPPLLDGIASVVSRGRATTLGETERAAGGALATPTSEIPPTARAAQIPRASR